MSYQVKKTLISLFGSLIIVILYITNILPQIGVLTDLSAWAKIMLVFIGLGAGLMIIIHILFHILLSVGIAIHERHKDEKAIEKTIENEMIEDEMTKLIELKSVNVGYIIISIGFVSGLILLALNYNMVLVLNVMYLSFYLGSIIEALVNIYFSLRGVRNA
jgi:hypothetical protein